MSTPRPVLYVKPGCPWCDDAEDFLKAHGIAYDRANVSGNRAAFDEMLRLSGQTKAPTMQWDDEILADFGVEELQEFLRERNVIK